MPAPTFRRLMQPGATPPTRVSQMRAGLASAVNCETGGGTEPSIDIDCDVHSAGAVPEVDGTRRGAAATRDGNDDAIGRGLPGLQD